MKKFFPIKFLIVAIIVSSCWSSCNDNGDPQPVANTITIDPPKDTVPELGFIRYLALGDSYTIGQSVDEDQRYPVQLATKLEADGYDSVEVQIIARTGWTTGQLNSAIANEDPQGPFDLVSLLIGVNNQFQGKDSTEYRAEFRDLLQQAIAFANGNPEQVFVVSIPDYGVTPFAEKMDTARIRAEIDGYNLINFEEAQLAGAYYVNITSNSRLARNDLSLLAPDLLHPSGKMYKQWVMMILPVARDILEEQQLIVAN